MKFSMIRLGTAIYFDDKTRDYIYDSEYLIEECENKMGYVVTHKRKLTKHFISIYNIAYGRIIEEQKEEPIKENDALTEAEPVNGSTEVLQNSESESPNLETKAARGKRSKKN